jgi:thymidylate synthase (FAD)
MSIKQKVEDGNFDVQPSSTRRPTVEAIDTLLYHPIPVLDHGFVRVIDYMGDDAAVVQAARVSYGRGTKKVSEDAALIRYLIRHAHTTPFEMCEIKLHVKLPIFVARQWIRHRTASVNEYSARYSILAREFYVPAASILGEQSIANRQGRKNEPIGLERADQIRALLINDAERAFKSYDWLLNEEGSATRDDDRPSLSRELARIGLPLSTYTEWYWKIDLHNLMHFLQLRADQHAQYEVRAYAAAILNIMRDWVPLVYAAFVEYRLAAATMSAPALAVVRKMIDGASVAQVDSGLSKREWRDLMELLERPIE